MARAYICCFLEQDYRLHTHLASFIIITGRKKILPDRRRGTLNSKCAPICVSTCCCHQVCFIQATMSFRNHWDTPTVIWASPPVNVNTMKNIKTAASPQTAEQTRWQLPLTAPTHSVKACQRYSTRGPGINMDKMGGGRHEVAPTVDKKRKVSQ